MHHSGSKQKKSSLKKRKDSKFKYDPPSDKDSVTILDDTKIEVDINISHSWYVSSDEDLDKGKHGLGNDNDLSEKLLHKEDKMKKSKLTHDVKQTHDKKEKHLMEKGHTLKQEKGRSTKHESQIDAKKDHHDFTTAEPQHNQKTYTEVIQQRLKFSKFSGLFFSIVGIILDLYFLEKDIDDSINNLCTPRRYHLQYTQIQTFFKILILVVWIYFEWEFQKQLNAKHPDFNRMNKILIYKRYLSLSYVFTTGFKLKNTPASSNIIQAANYVSQYANTYYNDTLLRIEHELRCVQWRKKTTKYDYDWDYDRDYDRDY